ncbi:MAG: hypothetical protein ACRDBY_12915 [Cetobacterium sp.]
MGKIRVGSTVVLNSNIVEFVIENTYLKKEVCDLLLKWYNDELDFCVIAMYETVNRGINCNIEGFAIPISCLDLADMQK